MEGSVDVGLGSLLRWDYEEVEESSDEEDGEDCCDDIICSRSMLHDEGTLFSLRRRDEGGRLIEVASPPVTGW